jgi:cytochrome c556
MSRARFWGAAAVIGVACVLTQGAQSQPAVKTKVQPKLEPVAETKLLMEGLAQPNLRGLGKALKDRPAEAEAWRFARGQALLVAETGNLLMMRPPKVKDTTDTWMARSTELREAAAALARSAAAQDYPQARSGLAAVANACNRCHQSFRVPARVNPFADDE